jgi:hypothetical protein
MHLDPAILAEVALGAGGVIIWFGIYGVALLLTRPADVQPAPPTQDFGGEEPPAVVSLLTNRWEITEDAAESTLIDLAARRHLEFRQPANDPMQTTIHIGDAPVSGLTPYESMIFKRVKGLAVNGMVPLTALTFRDEGEAGRFATALHGSIIGDARARGLSRRRFSTPLISALSAAGLFPALAIGAAVALDMMRRHKLTEDWFGAAVAVMIVWAMFSGFAGKKRGERDTPLGQQVASRWLGLQAYLRGDESFADLPPSAVAVWDRYLSYGDAVGATRVCSAVIDLGMGNRKRVWSHFGGSWHRVKVRYPAFWRRYGQKAVPLFVKAILALAFCALVYKGSARLPTFSNSVSGYVSLAVGLLFLTPLFYGIYTLVFAIIDVITPVTITGELLWTEVWKSTSGGENRPARPWLYHFAVDNGGDDRTVAWGCPSDIVHKATVGDVVTFTARRWTRRILTLEVVERGRERALAAATATMSPSNAEDTGNIVLAAFGGGSNAAGAFAAQALATALQTPEIAPAQLINVEEVSRAVGIPVVADGRRGAAVGPISVEAFLSANGGKRLVFASVASGTAADLAIRMRRRFQPLPGIGDEAYAGEHWAIGRRGRNVVMLQLHGDAKRIDPRNVYWLLSTAVSRLP